MGPCTSIFSSCVNKQEVKQMGGRYKAQNQLTPLKVMNTLIKWIFTFPEEQQEFMTIVAHWAMYISDFCSVFCLHSCKPYAQAVIADLPDTGTNDCSLFAVTGCKSYTEKAGGEAKWKISNWS